MADVTVQVLHGVFLYLLLFQRVSSHHCMHTENSLITRGEVVLHKWNRVMIKKRKKEEIKEEEKEKENERRKIEK